MEGGLVIVDHLVWNDLDLWPYLLHVLLCQIPSETVALDRPTELLIYDFVQSDLAFGLVNDILFWRHTLEFDFLFS